jgi:hypothetical protein
MINSKEVIEFKNVIGNLLDRPGMYLINKVEDYELFFLGYELALKSDNVTEYIRGFNLFVNNWAELGEEKGWAKLIRFYSSTDIHSVELFTKLFREYAETNN